MITYKDASVTTTYGYYKCSICGAQFYGNGPAIHDLDACKNTEYLNCSYFVGPLCPEWDAAETIPVSFDEWCYSKQIKGNFKEALWHSLAAKQGADKIESLGQDAWAQEWKLVLDKFMAKALELYK